MIDIKTIIFVYDAIASSHCRDLNFKTKQDLVLFNKSEIQLSKTIAYKFGRPVLKFLDLIPDILLNCVKHSKYS